jgi:GxxExxY protein
MGVRRAVGPGLLESAYEACLAFELRQRGLKIEQQKPLPVIYKDVKLDCGYRLDIVVDDLVIVEVKALEKVNSVHEARLLSYLRLYECHLGLLLNFHVAMLKHGIRRVVNEFPNSGISASSAVKAL